MNRIMLERYARLIVKAGINLQKVPFGNREGISKKFYRNRKKVAYNP